MYNLGLPKTQHVSHQSGQIMNIRACMCVCVSVCVYAEDTGNGPAPGRDDLTPCKPLEGK